MSTALDRNQEVIDRYDDWVIGNYRRFPVALERGEGSRVYDAEGNEYLDLFPGWGCALLGHCPPRVVRAVQDQAAGLIHVPNTWHIEKQAELAEGLCRRLDFPAKAFFCNSGTEAIEAAIKLARLHARSTDAARYKVVSMTGGFHGRTMGALSATAQPKYHEGVGPMLAGFRYAKFGDLDSAADSIDDETAAILVEPVQGEGGINLPPDGYLEGLRELCDRHGLLLIFDEVQSGMGRTGRWYAHQHWGVTPDILTLAKAMAGGFPGGGMIARAEVAESLKPGTHAATFGGNPVTCAAALATIETIEDDGLLDRAAQVGERFREYFTRLQGDCPVIQEVRAIGGMVGVELNIDGTAALQACLERRLLINCTQGKVLRLLPALTVTDAEIEEGCRVMEDVLRAAAA